MTLPTFFTFFSYSNVLIVVQYDHFYVAHAELCSNPTYAIVSLSPIDKWRVHVGTQ